MVKRYKANKSNRGLGRAGRRIMSKCKKWKHVPYHVKHAKAKSKGKGKAPSKPKLKANPLSSKTKSGKISGKVMVGSSSSSNGKNAPVAYGGRSKTDEMAKKKRMARLARMLS